MELSGTAIEQLATHIDDVSREWVKEYIKQRQDMLRRRKIDASGRLIASMHFDITKAINDEVTNTIALAFEDHGRYIDMKRLNVPTGGLDYIQNLAGWIVQKGFLREFTSEFMANRQLRKVPQNILNQMAWGIAAKRSHGYRRKAWYAKSKTAAVSTLFNQVAAGIPDIVLSELKAAFTTAK